MKFVLWNTLRMKFQLSYIYQRGTWPLTYTTEEQSDEVLICYSRITSKMTPSLDKPAFSDRPTKLTVSLPQSHDCSCYVSRRILTLPPVRLQKQTNKPRTYKHSHKQFRALSQRVNNRLVSGKLSAPQAGNFMESILLYTQKATHRCIVQGIEHWLSQNLLKIVSHVSRFPYLRLCFLMACLVTTAVLMGSANRTARRSVLQS